MPHFNANKVIILERKDVPKGYTLEEIFDMIKEKQYPIKVRRGAIALEIGTVLRVYLGRDAIVGDIGFDPVFKLILEAPKEKEDEEPVIGPSGVATPVLEPKYLEWGN